MEKKESTYVPGAKYAIVKAGFDLEAAKKNYQVLLQNLASVTVTRDNVNEDLTKDGREVLKMLADKKDADSKEPLQWHRDIMAVYKSVADPVAEQVTRILAEKKVVSAEIEADKEKQLKEQNRINTAKTAIIDFTNKVAGLINSAKTDTDIVNVEKMIGLEKTRKNVYQEFVPDLITACDALRPQINDQKENIRQLQVIEEKERAAIDTGDIIAATALREEKEYVAQVIQETGIRISEKAFEQASVIDIVAPEVMDVAPKGRTNWKWKLEDIKLLQKKMPHLVKVVPDDEAIDLLLKTKKQDGSLDGKYEEKYFGITFYNDKSFSR